MKLNYKRTFTIGFAFFAISAFWQLYDHCVPLMLKNTFAIPDGPAGIIMAADNMLALVMLPLFGYLSDRTKSRLGRRMPYILAGSFGAIVSVILIPIANQAVSLVFFSIALACSLLFMSSYRNQAVALMPDVTLPPLRSKANAIINLMGALGAVAILALNALMLPPKEEGMAYLPNYIPIYAACAAIMLTATLVLLLFVKENKLVEEMHAQAKQYGIDLFEGAEDADPANAPPMAPPVRRSFFFLVASLILWFMGYNAVTTAFSKYCQVQFELGAGESALVLIIANAAAIVSFLPVGIISTKIGRKKTILGGIVMLTTAFAVGGMMQTFNFVLYACFALAGIGWASINVNSYPTMVGMAHGSNVGKFTGYYYLSSMTAQIITPIVSGYMIQWISAATDEKTGYRFLFPYGAIFVALAFITMQFVRHGDEKPAPPEDKLAAFEALDG